MDPSSDVESILSPPSSPKGSNAPINIFNTNKKIKLDVGGKNFHTSLSTLTRLKPTFFSAMFSGQFNVKPDDDGTFFIDRDPLAFAHVLNYLRGDLNVHIEFLSPHEMASLRADAVYFGIEGINEMLDDYLARKETEEAQKIVKPQDVEEVAKRYTWDSRHCPSHFVISKSGRRLTSSNSTAGLITTNILVRPKKVTQVRYEVR
eukprot:TRINITY_DN5464_c0_g1_i2.p1 TRINITY_DN5464_c0_g1~~TRINITY_DN5464_c0_g1_i2.p1  ORF type:complete len:204 (+),score=19.58 TRINITY_DN5464_c0_g1_i2:44-655(+)